MVLSSELFASFPKYIFYFIGDGMGHAHVELAEKYSLATGRGGLAINSFTLKRSITTHPFTSELVTDSAAAGAENLRLLDCQKISMNLFSKQFVRLLEKRRNLRFDDVKNMITEFYGFKFAGNSDNTDVGITLKRIVKKEVVR